VLPLHDAALRTQDMVAVHVHAGIVHAIVRVWNRAGLIDGMVPTVGNVLDEVRLNENCADILGWVDADGDTCEDYACNGLFSAT
jgi:hypothetical protein